MNRQELFGLVKNSKLAQVATPLGRDLRAGTARAPTHQLIYTPKLSASRSNYGIKTTLPTQVGHSHIVFNDIDNAKSMPDVEKYSGHLHNRLKFQESGIVAKRFTEGNPLFPQSEAAPQSDSILTSLKLDTRASDSDVQRVLARNPKIQKQFQSWLLEKYPEQILNGIPQKTKALLKEFIELEPLAKNDTSLKHHTRPWGRKTASSVSSVQGTAGFTYAQKGRLTNTPNGAKHGVIAPGRLVGEREAGIGGFVANINERSTLLQSNYSKNFPGKHSRQFVLPFKVNEAEISNEGHIRIYADGVRAGTWMSRVDTDADRGYKASHPNFQSAADRNTDHSALENLLGLISKE